MANPFNKEAPIRNAASELPGVLGQGAPIQYAATEEITENRFLGQEVPIHNAAPEEKLKNSFLGQEVPIQNAAPEEPKKIVSLGKKCRSKMLLQQNQWRAVFLVKRQLM